ERQQLRGGGRVRRQSPGDGGHRRRRERPPRFAPLRRSGRTLRERRPAQGVLLSRAAPGPHRTVVPPPRGTRGARASPRRRRPRGRGGVIPPGRSPPAFLLPYPPAPCVRPRAR